MYKNIVPGLVSLETKLKRIPGSFLFKNLDFYPPVEQPNKFHYHLALSSHIMVPTKYDFRNAYYQLTGGIWYYQRRLPSGLTLKFSFDESTNTFLFNSTYLKIPFEIGGILPIGLHVTDMIMLNLSSQGYLVLRGAAYELNGSVTALIAPSFNGKTTLLNEILERGGYYLAEDVLILDPAHKSLYPTPSIAQNFGRKINAATNHKAKFQMAAKSQAVDKLIFFYNRYQGSKLNVKADFADYFLLNSLAATGNNFIKSYAFVNHLAAKASPAYAQWQNWLNEATFTMTDNFNFTSLAPVGDSQNRDHWNDLGSKYSDVWQSPAKRALSAAELRFVSKHLAATPAKRVVDIGIGNGRILQEILQNPGAQAVYGLDIAEAMVKVCQDRFQAEPRVQKLAVVNLAEQDLPFSGDFDFASSIRVLKYNQNWRDIIPKVTSRLKPGGIFVFSIPNKNSLNRFSSYAISSYKSSRAEVQALAHQHHLELLEISGFTKVPDKIYELFEKRPGVSLILLEKLLSKILGSTFLARELFVVVRRPK